MKSVEEAKVSGKKVIVRCDFDDPIIGGKIVDDARIKSNIPTLKHLLNSGASLFLISKLGRPEGRDPNLSMRIVLETITNHLGEKITFKENLTREKTDNVTLLENTRFWKEEEEGDLDFSKKIASFGDLYVNECFATSHRNDASIAEVPKLLPSFAGLNLFEEVKELKKILESPARPLVAIIGGAKLETKLPAIYNLAKIADKVLVGGRLMFEVKRGSLPENVVVAHDDSDTKDIGLKSIDLFKELIADASTIVWNGPMGVFEENKYMKGTEEVAKSVVESKSYSVVGGGDTVSALNKLELLEKINFVSMGGGAMLDFLAGKKLPGLEALGFYE
jgi:phosphoglycerate kinase